MMNRENRKMEVVLSKTFKHCGHYQGSIPLDGRKMVEGSGRFFIRNPQGVDYYVGTPGQDNNINWSRVAGAATKITGYILPHAHYWQIHFDDLGEVADGEEIIFTYEWTPHHLHGAEVMVRVNNEERWVPITELQAALSSYLGE